MQPPQWDKSLDILRKAGAQESDHPAAGSHPGLRHHTLAHEGGHRQAWVPGGHHPEGPSGHGRQDTGQQKGL